MQPHKLTSLPALLPAQRQTQPLHRPQKESIPDSCIWASHAFPYSNPKWYFTVKYCYLLRNARPKEYDQDSINILPFKGRIQAAVTLWVFLQPLPYERHFFCIGSETQPLQKHATCYAAGVGFCTGENTTMKRTSAMSATGIGVMQKSRVQFLQMRKKIHTLRSQIKWLFWAESSTQNKLIIHPRENSTSLL